MTLIKSNNGLKNFGSFLSDFFEAEDLSLNRLWKRDLTPAVNVSEHEKGYEIEFAAPGMRKSDFKVNVVNGVLNVSAERKEEKEETKKNYTRQEYSYYSFSRSFSLPENAKEDDIKAQYEDGVLRLNVAKKTAIVSKAKEISVS